MPTTKPSIKKGGKNRKKRTKPKRPKKTDEVAKDVEKYRDEEEYLEKKRARARQNREHKEQVEPLYFNRQPPPPYEYSYQTQYKPKTSSKPTIAGVLLIITGVIGILFAALIIFLGSIFGGLETGMGIPGYDEKVELRGTVESELGEPIGGVNVSIIDTFLSSETDLNGKFTIKDVPTGKQRIKVEKARYKTLIYKTFVTPTGEAWQPIRDYDTDTYENDFEFTLELGNGTEEDGGYPPFAAASATCYSCGVVAIIFSFISIIGGYFAINRRKFAIAMMGAILGIFTLGFILGSILAIIALFLLIFSRDDFRRAREKYPVNP